MRSSDESVGQCIDKTRSSRISSYKNAGVGAPGGAIPKLIALLGHGGVVAEQSAWALGNIAGDGPITRVHVVGVEGIPRATCMNLFITVETGRRRRCVMLRPPVKTFDLKVSEPKSEP
ncbi:Importin subunit alpha [Operophtera brumata]|uniref:Importin subunit alpha n=1 Tax=Operophtera brumata TaxID=104452 RepID=A0A0L7L5V8_OPEBR|nr:Importin subunit alpha [Operophtera brumata]